MMLRRGRSRANAAICPNGNRSKLMGVTVRAPDRRRYGWHRRYNGFTGDSKWRLIATMTALPVAQVIAVVDDICETANQGRPRGSIADFSVLECWVKLDVR